MLAVEGVKRAQERFGKGKVMTGEQVRWGLENLALDQKKLDALGFAGVMRPISTSCADHMRRLVGAHPHLGRQRSGTSRPTGTQADESIIKPMVKAAAEQVRGREEDRRRQRPHGRLPERESERRTRLNAPTARESRAPSASPLIEAASAALR